MAPESIPARVDFDKWPPYTVSSNLDSLIDKHPVLTREDSER